MRRRVHQPGSAQRGTSGLCRHNRRNEHRPALRRTSGQPWRRGVAFACPARRREPGHWTLTLLCGRWTLTLPGRGRTLTFAGGCRGLELRCRSRWGYPSRSTGLQRTMGGAPRV